jgi:hypothetical protein
MPQSALLSLDDYPNIDLADIGKLPNVVLGTVEGVLCHAIVGGATALLTADLTNSATSFDVDNAERFPAAPFTIQIATERMRVTNVASETFTVTRGYDDTEPLAHKQNKTVFELLTEYVYLVADHPVKEVLDVYVDGQLQIADVTFYTGQGGDEHPDWPGKAVVAFDAEAFMSAQFNQDDAADMASGETVSAVPRIASHPHLMDGLSTFVTLSPSSPGPAWVAFDNVYGSIQSQEVTASLSNPSETVTAKGNLMLVTAAGALLRLVKWELDPGDSVNLPLTHDEGSGDDYPTLTCITGEVKVTSITRQVTRAKESVDSTSMVSYTPAVISDNLDGHDTLNKWVRYPTTSRGTIIKQAHQGSITVTGETLARVALVAADEDGTLLGSRLYEDLPAGSYNLALAHDGGSANTMTKIVPQLGDIETTSLGKTIFFEDDKTIGAATLASTSGARIVVGDNITVDVQGKLDTDGNYGGIGTLIERPDWVIKRYIVDHMGFVVGDINAASFTAAGSSYASAIAGGYKFGFVITDRVTPSQFLKRMAFESRSTIKLTKGEWFLNYLPDTAPAQDKTIANDELAGQGSMFTFDKGNIYDIANEYEAKYKRVYTQTQLTEGDWGGVITDSDATSKTKYGTYPKTVEFQFIRLEAMAIDVLAHILLQSKDTLKTITFPVFWEHFDLGVGDTVLISNPLFNGEKYYIEDIRRNKEIVTITAKEWWQ